MRQYFQLDELQTNVRQEFIGGLTTFLTMAYIVIVNPKILEAAGIPFGASMTATIISAFFGTLTMGVYAKRPFAIAPYMGENAFIAYTVVNVLGYSWQTAIGAILISGVLFTILTALKLRTYLADSIPESLKIGFAVGIGLFLAFIGLVETKIVVLGVEGAPLHVGDFTDPTVLLAIFGFLLTAILLMKNITGAILISILLVSVIAFGAGLAPVPQELFSAPPSIGPIFLELDIFGALQWGFFAVILTVFVMDFVDTIGTLMALAITADLLDEDGNLPGVQKVMMSDALATVVAALCGTTTTGAYIESATGIKAGARSGLASVFTAFLFLSMLFLAPLFTAIPAYAYGPALIIVGLLMMKPITRLHADDFTEIVPVFIIILLMSFTYNMGIGMTAGFVSFPLFKVMGGQKEEVTPGMWILGGLSLLFFVFYPY